MKQSPVIKLLWRAEIDDRRWNECIAAADNSLIYAQTWYLDALCDDWCAVIQDEYDAVLPLPWRTKWGIRYVYTPYFVPALSLFAKAEALPHAASFFEVAASHFRYLRMDVDVQKVSDLSEKWQQQVRANQIIQPGQAHYSRLINRKLDKAVKCKLMIESGVDATALIEAYRRAYHAQHKKFSMGSYIRFSEACKATPNNGLITLAAHLPDEPFAGFYILFTDERNVYSLLGGSTKKGKSCGAFYALTHHAVQLAMNNNKTFRFEGSDVPGIHFFNRQFGAVDKPYVQLLHNDLPKLLKWMKS